MSLRRNVLANYVSQLYVAVIGILMLPLYIQYMGVEAFGLVGFYAMLQAWFQLLDVGLTPTMAREAARYRGGGTTSRALRQLFCALQAIFAAIGVLGATALALGANGIAQNWLKIDQLPISEVQHSISLMAAIVALRWISGLYRSAITGFEKLVWLSGFSIAVATARFVGVIWYFILVGTTPTNFFSYQLAIAVLEVSILYTKANRLVPNVHAVERQHWEWQPLRAVLKFSLTVAFTSSTWILVTNTDKLILSKMLQLSEYAYFALAVLVGSGVILVSGPISTAILPRLTKLYAEGKEAEFLQLYRHATQLVGVIATTTALVLAFFPVQVLWAWTGNMEIARHASPVLALYALGNGILVLAAFPYYLQYAKGDLKLHLIGNAVFVVALVPVLILTTVQYGTTGAGFAWFGTNVAYFLFWVPNVHMRLAKGLHLSWILRDVCAVVIPALVVVTIVRAWFVWPHDRILTAIGLCFVFAGLCLAAAIGSSWIRSTVYVRLHNTLSG